MKLFDIVTSTYVLFEFHVDWKETKNKKQAPQEKQTHDSTQFS